MSVRCCGVERDTPFCPSCGKKLGAENPLVGLLQYIRKQIKVNETKWEQERRRVAGWRSDSVALGGADDSETVKDALKRLNGWKVWESTLDSVLSGDHAAVMSDWLEENGYPDAARALRGTFCA